MFTKVYDMVVSLMGPVPIEFEFLYAVGVCIIFTALVWAVVIPFKLLYDVVIGRW